MNQTGKHRRARACFDLLRAWYTNGHSKRYPKQGSEAILGKAICLNDQFLILFFSAVKRKCCTVQPARHPTGLPVGGVPMAPGLEWCSQAPGQPGSRVHPQAVVLGGRRPSETNVPQAGLPLSSWCVSISCVPGSESGVARLRFGWIQGFAEDPQGVKAGHQTPSPGLCLAFHTSGVDSELLPGNVCFAAGPRLAIN